MDLVKNNNPVNLCRKYDFLNLIKFNERPYTYIRARNRVQPQGNQHFVTL